MFDHVTIRVADRAASERFYDTAFAPLGIDQNYKTPAVTQWGEFLVTAHDEAHAPTQRLHAGFASPSREQGDDFWREGTDAGYRSDGEPGPRPQYREDYYGAFLLDPDGNSIEAVDHGATRRNGGVIDPLWIRGGDLSAARSFYAAIAPHAGLRLADETPDRVTFAGDAGSFSL